MPSASAALVTSEDEPSDAGASGNAGLIAGIVAAMVMVLVIGIVAAMLTVYRRGQQRATSAPTKGRISFSAEHAVFEHQNPLAMAQQSTAMHMPVPSPQHRASQQHQAALPTLATPPREVALDRAQGQSVGMAIGRAGSATLGVPIIDIIPGGLADLAGVTVGDTIVSINGKSCLGFTQQEAGALVVAAPKLEITLA